MLIARLYHGIEAASCQAERIFSLSLLLNNLRSSMAAFKVERMMFLRLNQRVIPEVHTLMEVLDHRSAASAECAKNVAVAQEELAGREENLCEALHCYRQCHSSFVCIVHLLSQVR